MEPSGTRSGTIRFGVFEADLQSGELHKNGRKIRLQDQPFRVLALLLQRPGEVVTREEIRKQLWGDDTFVDFDHSLNMAVKKIREALGDSASTPRFVETVPRRGYRFIPAVNAAGENRRRASGALPKYAVTAIGLVLLGAIALALWIAPHTSSTSQNPPRVVPLTTYPGWEDAPAFSPDGSQIAFSFGGDKMDNYDIYTKVIGEENALRLTRDPAFDGHPSWSPDGRYIAFLRRRRNGSGVYMYVAVTGGPARELVESRLSTFQESRPVWSADSRALIIPHKDSDSGAGLHVLSFHTRDLRPLTSPPNDHLWDCCAALSPDGHTLAFIRHGSIYLLEVDDSLVALRPPRVLAEGFWRDAPAWMADGRYLVAAHGWGAAPELVRIPVTGHRVRETLTYTGPRPSSCPAISPGGDRLAFCSADFEKVNIWRLGLPAERVVDMDGGPAEMLISSSRVDSTPLYSPDGSKVAFVSERSGKPEIWICDSDGRNVVQVTSFGQEQFGRMAWAPDGRQLAFTWKLDVFNIALDGGPAKRLVSDSSSDIVCDWSGDGSSIYFASNRSGQFEIWKLPATGGDPANVAHSGTTEAYESPDGRFLYFAKKTDAGGKSLWKVPVGGGTETPALSRAETWESFNVAASGFYFLVREQGRRFAIEHFSFKTTKTETVAEIRFRYESEFSVSPDGRWVLFSKPEVSWQDLMLVENFR